MQCHSAHHHHGHERHADGDDVHEFGCIAERFVGKPHPFRGDWTSEPRGNRTADPGHETDRDGRAARGARFGEVAAAHGARNDRLRADSNAHENDGRYPHESCAETNAVKRCARSTRRKISSEECVGGSHERRHELLHQYRNRQNPD